MNDNEEVFFRNEIAKEIMIQQNNSKEKMYHKSLIAAEKERNSLREEIKSHEQQATEYIEHNQRSIKRYI